MRDGRLERRDDIVSGTQSELARGAMRHMGHQRKAAIEHHSHAPADRLDPEDPAVERVPSARRWRDTPDDHAVGWDSPQGELPPARAASGAFGHLLTTFPGGALTAE